MSRLIDLGKLRFQFRGDYDNSAQYERNDVVKYGGNAYVLNSDTKSKGVNPVDGNWGLLVEGFKVKGEWSSGVEYKVNEIILRGASQYICISGHVSGATFAADEGESKWALFSLGFRYRGAWAPSTSYLKGDLVRDAVSTLVVLADYQSGTVSSNADIAAGKLDYFARGALGVPVIDETVTSDMVIGNAGGIPVWVEGKPKVNVVSSDTTFKDGQSYAINSEAGTFSLFLPATPKEGFSVYIWDGVASTNKNPVNVVGNDFVFEINQPGQPLRFTFIDNTWSVTQ